jgi:glutamate 5-kinase
MTVAAAARDSRLAAANRVVVKIGSTLLVEKASGRLNRGWLESLADDLSDLRERGQEVVLVSSGAVALGRRHLGLPPGPVRLEESQAAAAVGQIRLAHAWKEVLEHRGFTVAQVLLTLGDTEQRRRYLNARNTLTNLLRFGAIPVINENDTVATAELRYGDNDRLAARVAQMVSADCLVLLSDVAGFYTADPTQDRDARLIPVVERITPELEVMAGQSASDIGSGGMATKLLAAKVAVAAGCSMCIAAGREKHPIRHIAAGGPCTWFHADKSPVTARKQWIAGTLSPSGQIDVDQGAAEALRKGRSLLPAGMLSVGGRFDRGDAVLVRDPAGIEIARGLAAYSSVEAMRICGHRSSELEGLLGYRGRDEMIHRDDLVLM